MPVQASLNAIQQRCGCALLCELHDLAEPLMGMLVKGNRLSDSRSQGRPSEIKGLSEAPGTTWLLAVVNTVALRIRTGDFCDRPQRTFPLLSPAAWAPPIHAGRADGWSATGLPTLPLYPLLPFAKPARCFLVLTSSLFGLSQFDSFTSSAPNSLALFSVTLSGSGKNIYK